MAGSASSSNEVGSLSISRARPFEVQLEESRQDFLKKYGLTEKDVAECVVSKSHFWPMLGDDDNEASEPPPRMLLMDATQGTCFGKSKNHFVVGRMWEDGPDDTRDSHVLAALTLVVQEDNAPTVESTILAVMKDNNLLWQKNNIGVQLLAKTQTYTDLDDWKRRLNKGLQHVLLLLICAPRNTDVAAICQKLCAHTLIVVDDSSDQLHVKEDGFPLLIPRGIVPGVVRVTLSKYHSLVAVVYRFRHEVEKRAPFVHVLSVGFLHRDVVVEAGNYASVEEFDYKCEKFSYSHGMLWLSALGALFNVSMRGDRWVLHPPLVNGMSAVLPSIQTKLIEMVSVLREDGKKVPIDLIEENEEGRVALFRENKKMLMSGKSETIMLNVTRLVQNKGLMTGHMLFVGVLCLVKYPIEVLVIEMQTNADGEMDQLALLGCLQRGVEIRGFLSSTQGGVCSQGPIHVVASLHSVTAWGLLYDGMVPLEVEKLDRTKEIMEMKKKMEGATDTPIGIVDFSFVDSYFFEYCDEGEVAMPKVKPLEQKKMSLQRAANVFSELGVGISVLEKSDKKWTIEMTPEDADRLLARVNALRSSAVNASLMYSTSEQHMQQLLACLSHFGAVANVQISRGVSSLVDITENMTANMGETKKTLDRVSNVIKAMGCLSDEKVEALVKMVSGDAPPPPTPSTSTPSTSPSPPPPCVPPPDEEPPLTERDLDGILLVAKRTDSRFHEYMQMAVSVLMGRSISPNMKDKIKSIKSSLDAVMHVPLIFMKDIVEIAIAHQLDVMLEHKNLDEFKFVKDTSSVVSNLRRVVKLGKQKVRADKREHTLRDPTLEDFWQLRSDTSARFDQSMTGESCLHLVMTLGEDIADFHKKKKAPFATEDKAFNDCLFWCLLVLEYSVQGEEKKKRREEEQEKRREEEENYNRLYAIVMVRRIAIERVQKYTAEKNGGAVEAWRIVGETALMSLVANYNVALRGLEKSVKEDRLHHKPLYMSTSLDPPPFDVYQYCLSILKEYDMLNERIEGGCKDENALKILARRCATMKPSRKLDGLWKDCVEFVRGELGINAWKLSPVDKKLAVELMEDKVGKWSSVPWKLCFSKEQKRAIDSYAKPTEEEMKADVAAKKLMDALRGGNDNGKGETENDEEVEENDDNYRSSCSSIESL